MKAQLEGEKNSNETDFFLVKYYVNDYNNVVA